MPFGERRVARPHLRAEHTATIHTVLSLTREPSDKALLPPGACGWLGTEEQKKKKTLNKAVKFWAVITCSDEIKQSCSLYLLSQKLILHIFGERSVLGTRQTCDIV